MNYAADFTRALAPRSRRPRRRRVCFYARRNPVSETGALVVAGVAVAGIAALGYYLFIKKPTAPALPTATANYGSGPPYTVLAHVGDVIAVHLPAGTYATPTPLPTGSLVFMQQAPDTAASNVGGVVMFFKVVSAGGVGIFSSANAGTPVALMTVTVS